MTSQITYTHTIIKMHPLAHILDILALIFSSCALFTVSPNRNIYPARGRVGRVTDCGVRGLGFKSQGSILTSRTETSSLSRVVRNVWDPCSGEISG